MTGIEFILDLAIVALIAGIAGLICRALHISVVVGYLVAGIIIGPYTPPFLLVNDSDRIQMLADLGLIFLIFGIGLGFSLRRMRRLGMSLPIATAIGAILILLMTRAGSFGIGLTDLQGLFIAGVLMVSSSAIIAKVLEEIRANHTRWGQLALGVTLLEDIVAIIMLTLLTSMVYIGGDGETSIWQTIFSFTGFVVMLSVLVILLVPKLLRWLDQKAIGELRMLLVAGLLLGLGWLSVSLGYSMALTAFILGAIIGSTPQSTEVDRLFEGLRHLFGAVFFVAMGMMFNIMLLPEFWPLMLALVLAAILLRMMMLLIGLVACGNEVRDSIRASLTLTPLGEFSFVIAFLGVQSGVMPETFYPAAVGASLLTCLLSPELIRRADSLSTRLDRAIPTPIHNWLDVYHLWLERLHTARSRSITWRLIAPRILQTVLLLLLVGGCFAFVPPLHNLVYSMAGPDLLIPGGTNIILFIAVGLLLLPPIVAIWRNIGALSMMIAEVTTPDHAPDQMARRLVQQVVTSASLFLVALWIFALMPTDLLPLPLLLAILLILVLTTILLWKKLVIWQSRMEIHLKRELAVAGDLTTTEIKQGWNMNVFEEGIDWKLRVEEFTVPTNSAHAGMRILDLQLRTRFGCSIVGIDRQGFAINNPSRNEVLFPGDKLLLLGTSDVIRKTTEFLSAREDKPVWLNQFDHLTTEKIIVPQGSPYHGQTLRDLDLVSRHGVQIAGIQRSGEELNQPGAGDMLKEGDALLVVGTHDHIRGFSEALGGEVK